MVTTATDSFRTVEAVLAARTRDALERVADIATEPGRAPKRAPNPYPERPVKTSRRRSKAIRRIEAWHLRDKTQKGDPAAWDEQTTLVDAADQIITLLARKESST